MDINNAYQQEQGPPILKEKRYLVMIVKEKLREYEFYTLIFHFIKYCVFFQEFSKAKEN